MTQDRLITVAIHTYDKALELRAMLEAEGIQVTFQNCTLMYAFCTAILIPMRLGQCNLLQISHTIVPTIR